MNAKQARWGILGIYTIYAIGQHKSKLGTCYFNCSYQVISSASFMDAEQNQPLTTTKQ